MTIKEAPHSLFSKHAFLRYPDEIKGAGNINLSTMLNTAHANLIHSFNMKANQEVAMQLQNLLNALYQKNSWKEFADSFSQSFAAHNATGYVSRQDGSLGLQSLMGHSAKQAVTVFNKGATSISNAIIGPDGFNYSEQWWNLLQNNYVTKDQLLSAAYSYFGMLGNYHGKMGELVMQHISNIISHHVEELSDQAIDSVSSILYGQDGTIAAKRGRMLGAGKHTLGDEKREVRISMGEDEEAIRIYDSQQKTDVTIDLKLPGENDKQTLGISMKSSTKLRRYTKIASDMNVFAALANSGLGGVNNRILYSALTIYDDKQGIAGNLSVDLNVLNKIMLIKALRGLTQEETQAEFMVLWTGTGSKSPFRVISTSSFLTTIIDKNDPAIINRMAKFIYNPTVPPIGESTQGINPDTGGRTDATLTALLNWKVSIELSSDAYKLSALSTNWA